MLAWWAEALGAKPTIARNEVPSAMRAAAAPARNDRDRASGRPALCLVSTRCSFGRCTKAGGPPGAPPSLGAGGALALPQLSKRAGFAWLLSQRSDHFAGTIYASPAHPTVQAPCGERGWW